MQHKAPITQKAPPFMTIVSDPEKAITNPTITNTIPVSARDIAK